MAKKTFENQYRLPNKDVHITDPEELDRIFEDYAYFAENYQQIVDKNGVLRPMRLNPAQKVLAKRILPMIMKDTRLDRKHNVVILKARQMGGSTLVVSLINYLCAFVEGINNLHMYHIFPVGASGGKFYNTKVLPILTGVHPDLYPTMECAFNDSTTKEIVYWHTKGAIRNNRYEIVSANASSLRGGTGQVLILDEVADYTKPHDLEAAISPAIPDFGFSLVMYLSTFSDKRSSYFLDKIKTAMENPDDWTLVFIPWYFIYPEVKQGINLEELDLTEYDRNVIIPSLEKDDMPKGEWGDCISWYHRKQLEMPLRIRQEYPTTIEEVISLGSNEKVFSPKDIERLKTKGLSISGTSCNISTDVLTNKVLVSQCQDSPLRIYKKPLPSHHYTTIVDPITSASDGSDFFAATVMDSANHEQVATIRGRGIPEEEWAMMTWALCRYYNRALICPESNVAEGFKATIWNLGYYNWYYVNALARKNRSPGIRTTSTSKVTMIERLQYLIKNDMLILHDPDWIRELEIFERKVKRVGEERSIVTYAAPGKQHDDTVSTLWIYAGTLQQNQLSPHVGRRPLIIGG